MPSSVSLHRPARSFELLIGLLGAVLATAVLWPGLSLGLTVVFAIVGLAALRVDALLYIAVFCLPLAPILQTGLPIHDVSTIVRLCMFCGFYIGSIAEGGSVFELILRDRLNYLVLLYGGVATASVVVFNHGGPLSQRALVDLLSYLCFYFTVAGWVRSAGQLKIILATLFVSTICVALYGFYQAMIGDYGDLYFLIYPNQISEIMPYYWAERITSFLNYCNSLAGYLNLVMPYCLAIILVPVNRTLSLLARLCLITASVALLLTESRGAFFAYGSILVLAILCFSRSAKQRKNLLVAFLIIALALLPLFSTLATRVSTLVDASSIQRFMFWTAAWGMFVSSPLTGVGYGRFKELYELPGLQSGIYDVHNLYLQLLSETGLVGFLVFGLLVLAIARTAIQRVRSPAGQLDRVVGFAALAGLAGVLVHGFVDFLFTASPQFGALFWMTIGLLRAGERGVSLPNGSI